MDTPFDDVPDWLVISENCKAIHVLHPGIGGRKKGSKKTGGRKSRPLVRQDLKDYRHQLGIGLCKLTRMYRIGKATLNVLDGTEPDCEIIVKELRTVLSLYAFYGGLIKNVVFGDKQYTRCNKRHFVYWYKFLELLETIDYRQAANIVLKQMEAEGEIRNNNYGLQELGGCNQFLYIPEAGI